MIRNGIDDDGQRVLVVIHPPQDWVFAFFLLGIAGFTIAQKFFRSPETNLNALSVAVFVVCLLIIASLVLRLKVIVGPRMVKERIVIWRRCTLPVEIRKIRIVKRGKTLCLQSSSEEEIFLGCHVSLCDNAEFDRVAEAGRPIEIEFAGGLGFHWLSVKVMLQCET